MSEKRITGLVEYHRDMEGEGLLPRDIIVWLPPGYKDGKESRYPVLYLHDGQNIFDPLTSYTGIDWQAGQTATRLMEAGRMREIIMVGIYNTDERFDEYSLSARGKQYRDFIINTLKPFIDKTYRTLPERQFTATIGSSMGGLVSFLLVWLHSETFSMAGCMSPSFIYSKNQAIKMLRKSGPPAYPLHIYMDCGGVSGEKMLYRGCKKVIGILRKKGFDTGQHFQFFYDERAGHSENAWAERLWRPLLFMFRTAGFRSDAPVGLK